LLGHLHFLLRLLPPPAEHVEARLEIIMEAHG
jgi:hypothetical protein